MPASFWAGYLLRLAVVFAALAATYVVARWLRATRLKASRGRCVSIVEITTLSPHPTLYVVRAGTRYLLIGSSAGAISVLTEVAPADIPTR